MPTPYRVVMDVDGRPVAFLFGQLPLQVRRTFFAEFNRLGGQWGRRVTPEIDARAEAFAIRSVTRYVTSADGMSGAGIVRTYARIVISSLLAQLYLQNSLRSAKARRRVQALGLAGAYRLFQPPASRAEGSHVDV